MGLGGYSFCEYDSIAKENSLYQQAFRELATRIILKCTNDWFPKLTPQQACGYLTPKSGEQFGRVPILPALFDDHGGTQMAHWRQTLDTAGHQILISGTEDGNVLPEDFKVGWLGLAFPNKNQHITEIRFQIGDRKYGRINLEEMRAYNKPALIFEKGLIINEKQSFELYGYVEGPIPNQPPFIVGLYQRIVMLGSAYYEVIDKVLGDCGAAL